ncbi:52 kDa repressor of the inhibitor of the protein kinase-like [Hydra vulgaris]|uniref:52 kDa repressor of the inhibitor of the protein kinase-like n=1 Tax=Hydra vulgaris TaxID=6087 RepID=A0ABM4CLE7_HYDVU
MKEMELYQALKANNHSLIDQIKLCNTAELNNFCQRVSEGKYILHKFSGAANGFIDAAASNSLARLYADKLIDKKTYSMVPVRIHQDGNCLFSAVSIALIGKNTLAPTLRKLCAIELYKNANFFALHPVFRLGHSSGIPLKIFYPTTGDACLEYLFRSTLYPQSFKKFNKPNQIIYLMLYNVDTKKEIPSNLTHMGKMHFFIPNHYVPLTVQNELIDVCAGVVRSLLTDRIKKAKFFSIFVDEASDVRQTEQMAVIVRYVDEFCNIKEDFLKFVSCNTGLSGVSLSSKIKKSIHKLGLEKSYCRGQGYDGASKMAGRLCGVAALILNDFSKAPYVHCFSHQLNLCVAKACVTPSIPDIMDHKLNICRTRWIENVDGLEAFIELYPAIVASLICIKEDVTWNYKSRGDASAYVAICCSFKFVITLIIVRKLLGYTRPLTKTLQKVDQDFSKARKDVKNLKNTLKSLRSSIDISHTEWYKEAVSIAATTNTMPSNPTCGQQTQRDNHEVDDISEYFRITCSIPFLDHILIQLDSLFSTENLVLLDSFSIIPSNLISDKDRKKNVKEFVCTYQNDLPEPRYFYAELDMLEVYWKNHSDSAPKTISDSLQKCDDHMFPNISTILRILCTLPVTTCICERSLSALKRIKTSLRNTMGDGCLNGIAMLHIH